MISRYKTATNEIVDIESIEVPLSSDNCVCFTCLKPILRDNPLGPKSGRIVSHPKGKGLLVLCCNDHINEAMEVIAKTLNLNYP